MEIDLTKQVQELSLEILREVVDVCRRNNIPYYLDGGTLLGAIRHGGFIPWDDDVDISIPISEMENFARCAKKELPPNMYVDLGFSSERHYSVLPDGTRVHNSEYGLVDRSGLEMDVYIDVCAMVGMPGNYLLRVLHYWKITFRRAMTRITRPEIIGVNHWTNRKGFRKYIIMMAQKINFNKIFSHEKQLAKLKKCVMKYPAKESKYVLIYPNVYGMKEVHPYEYYGDGIPGKFEDLDVTLPSQYDKQLTHLYSDYMQLPPEEERAECHFIKIIQKSSGSTLER